MAEREAKGYVDPGSGALLWQALVATFLGGMFYFRRAFGKLIERRRSPNRGTDHEELH